MTSEEKQGWYEDPADRDELRWFSQGMPTDLVKDRGLTGRDPLSIQDPKLFEDMNLTQAPQPEPPTPRPDTPTPRFAVIGESIVNLNESSPDPYWWPGMIEWLVILLPVMVGIPVLYRTHAPKIGYLAALGFSLTAAVVGYVRRRHALRRRR